MRKTIAAHTLVKNEARYVWFAVMSVINHVDKVLLWDTGSSDGTLEIIDEIRKTAQGKRKVEFREVGGVDPMKFTETRNEMLEATDSDWFMIVDGDEVWWEDSIKKLASVMQNKGDELESVISRSYNLCGDIYHYQSHATARYDIDGIRGHINIRAINRKIPGLHFAKPHGQQGLFDESGYLIQNRSKLKRVFLDSPYLHFTNVPRSMSRENDQVVPKRVQKLKYDLGESFPADFYYPEVLFRKRSDIVPSPWVKRSKEFEIKSSLLSPAKKVKNFFQKGKVGY